MKKRIHKIECIKDLRFITSCGIVLNLLNTKKEFTFNIEATTCEKCLGVMGGEK